MGEDQHASLGIFGAFPTILNVTVECIWHTAEALEGREKSLRSVEEVMDEGGGIYWSASAYFERFARRRLPAHNLVTRQSFRVDF